MKKKAVFYSCLKQLLFFKKYNSMKTIWRKRNTQKIVRVFIDGEKYGYLNLDRLNKNIYIEKKDDKIILFTDY